MKKIQRETRNWYRNHTVKWACLKAKLNRNFCFFPLWLFSKLKIAENALQYWVTLGKALQVPSMFVTDVAVVVFINTSSSSPYSRMTSKLYQMYILTIWHELVLNLTYTSPVCKWTTANSQFASFALLNLNEDTALAVKNVKKKYHITTSMCYAL